MTADLGLSAAPIRATLWRGTPWTSDTPLERRDQHGQPIPWPRAPEIAFANGTSLACVLSGDALSALPSGSLTAVQVDAIIDHGDSRMTVKDPSTGRPWAHGRWSVSYGAQVGGTGLIPTDGQAVVIVGDTISVTLSEAPATTDALAKRVRWDAPQSLTAAQTKQARDNIGADGALHYRGQVNTAQVSADTLTTIGVYWVTTSGGTAVAGWPGSGGGIYGILEVLPNAPSGGEFIRQRFYRHHVAESIPVMWARIKDGGTWLPWRELDGVRTDIATQSLSDTQKANARTNIGAVEGRSGTGSPLGVVTPTRVGQIYTDTAATLGARAWISTGTTSSSWRVLMGDVQTPLAPLNGALLHAESGNLLRRVGDVVELAVTPAAQSWTSGYAFAAIPPGFRTQSGYLPSSGYGGASATWMAVGAELRLYSSSIPTIQRWRWTWITNDPWPTTLP